MNVGDHVCMKGRGTDAMVHGHGTVVRLTKTMIIVERNGQTRRFARDGFHSLPYQPYGGLTISAKCQQR